MAQDQRLLILSTVRLVFGKVAGEPVVHEGVKGVAAGFTGGAEAAAETWAVNVDAAGLVGEARGQTGR